MTKNEFIEKYIDIPEESCDYIPCKKEMESDLNTLIETLLTEYQALQLQQTGVSGSAEFKSWDDLFGILAWKFQQTKSGDMYLDGEAVYNELKEKFDLRRK
jgi:hypothetical protein